MNTTVLPELDENINLRSDLWPTMTVSQLARQQEIVIDKISKMHQLLGPAATPSLINIYAALQVALQDLNKLIDSRASSKNN